MIKAKITCFINTDVEILCPKKQSLCGRAAFDERIAFRSSGMHLYVFCLLFGETSLFVSFHTLIVVFSFADTELGFIQ